MMRVGLSVTTLQPGDPSAAVGRVVERAKSAARAGLDHLSLGDQHAVGPDGQYLQNVPMLARLMADWPADRPAGLLFVVPLWHPVLAAEQIGTLAAMSNATFVVQTGIGHGAAQFAALGVPLAERAWRTDVAIPVIDRLLAGSTVSEPRLGIDGASVRPVPARPVEWWIGAGASGPAIERAARLGDAWYVSPWPTPAELAPMVARYREHCERHGTVPRLALRRDVYVAEDDDAAQRVGDRMAATGYRNRARSRGALVCGNVARVTSDLAAFAGLGVTDIVARCVDVPQDEAVATIELLGQVRAALAG